MNNTQLICVRLVFLSSFIYALLYYLFLCFIEYAIENPGPTLQITLCESPELKRSPIFWYDGANNVEEHYGNIIKILYGCPFEGWTNRAWPSHPFWAEIGWLAKMAMPCPVKSALKRKPVQDFDSFSIIFYYIISTSYQEIGDLFALFIFLDFCTVWIRND